MATGGRCGSFRNLGHCVCLASTNVTLTDFCRTNTSVFPSCTFQWCMDASFKKFVEFLIYIIKVSNFMCATCKE